MTKLKIRVSHFLLLISQAEKYSVIILFLFFASCSNGREKTGDVIEIDIEETRDVASINHTIEKVQVFPLETTKESLIGYVERIEYHKGKIFILDATSAKSLFVFSKEGDFLGKTKQGKGPGEMINPYAFCIDKVNNTVIVWDQTLSTLFTFDLELNPVSRKKLDFFISDIKKVNGNYLIYSQNPEKGAFTYKLFSGDFEKLLTSVDFPFSFEEGSMYLSRPINIGNRNLLITPNDYHIYQLDGPDIKPIFRMDFGSKAFDQKILDKAGAGKIFDLVHNSKNVSYPVDVFESKSFLGFQVMYGKEFYPYLISNKDGSILSVNDMISFNSLPKCLIRGTTGDDDNILFGLIDPDELIKYIEKENGEDKLNITNPNLDDNPYLIFFTVNDI